MIRAGVVGAGVFGGYHAQKYASDDRVRSLSVFDLDAPKATALSERVGAVSHTDFDLFLDSVDALSITAPASVHYHIAKEALGKGKHCLVEKPLAMTHADAADLVKTARDTDVVLQVGHQERFVVEAIGLSDRIRVADQLTFLRHCLPSGRCEDVCVVLDLMIHDLDIARQAGFGEPISLDAYGNANATEATFVFEHGRKVKLSASRRAESLERKLIVSSKQGETSFDFVSRTYSDGKTVNSDERALSDPLGFGVSHFIGAVLGDHKTAIPGESGLDAVAWAERIVVERDKFNKTGAVA